MHSRARQMMATMAIAGTVFAAGCASDSSSDDTASGGDTETTAPSGGGGEGVDAAAGAKTFAAPCPPCPCTHATGGPNPATDPPTSNLTESSNGIS